jgi:hypothetical protein
MQSSYHQKVNALLDKFNKLLTENDLSNLQSIIEKYDCAIITIFKKEVNNCIYGEYHPKHLKITENHERYKALKAKLLHNYYALFCYNDPSYIEDYKPFQDMGNTDIKLPVKVKEDSFFAVNIDNQANFIEEIINLGKLFCQDKVTIFEKGGAVNYVYGTSNANFPGLDKKEYFTHLYFGNESEFITKMGSVPSNLTAPAKKLMYFEHFINYQNSSKYLISIAAKKINELLY